MHRSSKRDKTNEQDIVFFKREQFMSKEFVEFSIIESQENRHQIIQTENFGTSNSIVQNIEQENTTEDL